MPFYGNVLCFILILVVPGFPVTGDLRSDVISQTALEGPHMSENGHRLDGPHFTLSMTGDIYGDDTPENHDIVRRIHACVSACEGISTEELEQGIIQDMARAIAQIVPLLQTEQPPLTGVPNTVTTPAKYPVSG